MAIRNESITNSLLDQPNLLLPSKSFPIHRDAATEDHHRKKKAPKQKPTTQTIHTAEINRWLGVTTYVYIKATAQGRLWKKEQKECKSHEYQTSLS